MFDLIAIGDPTIDTFLEISDATIDCTIDKNRCQLCINYADKIPVQTIHTSTAGNANNNAIAAARLGLKTAYYMIVGDDTAGERIKNKLVKENVSPDYFITDKKNSTNESTVINFESERTILVYHAPRTYKMPTLAPTKWIYYSSVNKGHERLNTAVIQHAKKQSIHLAYNPGTYQMLAGAEEMQRVIRHTAVTFVNKEEAERVVGREKDIKKLLKKLHNVGTKIAVITDGRNGSYTYDGTTFHRIGVYDSPVVERTGAGDSFATGFIAALFYKKDIPCALRWGLNNATSVLMHIGPQAGLLKKNQIDSFGKQFNHVQVETF